MPEKDVIDNISTFEVVVSFVLTVVGGLSLGLFWRIIDLPAKYMAKDDCQSQRDLSEKHSLERKKEILTRIDGVGKSVEGVHKRIDVNKCTNCGGGH